MAIHTMLIGMFERQNVIHSKREGVLVYELPNIAKRWVIEVVLPLCELMLQAEIHCMTNSHDPHSLNQDPRFW